MKRSYCGFAVPLSGRLLTGVYQRRKCKPARFGFWIERQAWISVFGLTKGGNGLFKFSRFRKFPGFLDETRRGKPSFCKARCRFSQQRTSLLFEIFFGRNCIASGA